MNRIKTAPERVPTWRAALSKTPGPETLHSGFFLWLKGLCMGTADIIPGVSGGTMALITGIYEQLLAAIKSIDAEVVSCLLRLDFRGAAAKIHLRFLIPLFLGIATAVVSLARLLNHLLVHHPVEIWSLFFGLISASIVIVGRRVRCWGWMTAFCFAAGLLVGYLIVGLIPLTTPETSWFVFFSGFIAICAMILPGISGAFILLILGKYEYITGALKNPFLPENAMVIIVFVFGCVAGLVIFSRFLTLLFQRFPSATLAGLAGLMTGSIQKIWPWKRVVETVQVHGRSVVVESKNVLPAELDAAVWAAVGLVAAGFAVVLMIERISRHPQG